MTTPPDIPVTMRVYSAADVLLCEFPYFTNLQVSDAVNDVGAYTFDWNLNSPNGSLLIDDSDIQMAVCMDFRDGNGFTEVWRGLYESDTYDPSMNESAVIASSGRSMVAILDGAVVYPQAGVGSTTTSWSFTGASPGKIFHDLFTAAQTRGCFPTLTWSFTSGQDSAGNAWTQGYTNAVAAGTSYLELLLGLAQGGLCDFKMVGTRLDLYNPNTTLAADRSSTVVFRRSRDIVAVPAQRDRTEIGTALLAVGDNGVNLEVTAGTIGALGRKEKYLAQAGVTDTTSLRYYANQAIAAIDDQKLSYTPTQVFDITRGTKLPWKDFFPGDYISLDTTGVPVKFRVTTWAVAAGPGGPTMFQPTLNDVFFSREVLLQNMLTGLTAGTVTGVGGHALNTASQTPAPGPNPTVPDVPAFLTADCYTAAYFSPATGTTLSQLELQWTTPLNTDGTVMVDGFQYVVQYRLSSTPIYPIAWSQLNSKPWHSVNGNPWSNPLDTPQNQLWTTVQVGIDDNAVTIGGLICGETYDFQIACTDVSGNTGNFSAVTAFLTAADNVAPGQPDAPTVFASMVSVQVQHDLQMSAGGPLPLDIDHLEVHYSYDPSFTPVPGINSATYLGKIIATAGMINAGIVAVGGFNMASTTGVTIKVIAVDTSGNRSQASPGSGVTAVLIDNDHISSLSVTKLLAGVITANIVIGATIGTALSGQRVQMDSTGLNAYDSGGNQIFSLSDSSPVIVLGTNGPSGNSIRVDTSQTYPTIIWSVIGSTSPAYINAINEGGGVTGLGINMGQYVSGIDSSVVSQQILLQGEVGVLFQILDTSESTHGWNMLISDTNTFIGVANHGDPITGGIFFESNGAFTDTAVQIEGYTSTFSVDPGSYDVHTSNTFSAGGGTFTINYGVTMMSAMNPSVQYSCSNTSVTPALNISANSTTGYSITMSAAAPVTFTIFTSSYRHN